MGGSSMLLDTGGAGGRALLYVGHVRLLGNSSRSGCGVVGPAVPAVDVSSS
jgi:hypothetical protein